MVSDRTAKTYQKNLDQLVEEEGRPAEELAMDREYWRSIRESTRDELGRRKFSCALNWKRRCLGHQNLELATLDSMPSDAEIAAKRAEAAASGESNDADPNQKAKRGGNCDSIGLIAGVLGIVGVTTVMVSYGCMVNGITDWDSLMAAL